jgi:hypothetical protein
MVRISPRTFQIGGGKIELNTNKIKTIEISVKPDFFVLLSMVSCSCAVIKTITTN